MITIPKKFCNKVNCKNLVELTNKYCEEHKEENNNYDKQRYSNDKEVRRTYNSTTWKTIRRNILIGRDSNMCLYCLHNGKYTKATVVDHYIPVRDAYERRYDADNLVSACVQCNTRKSVDEDKLRNNQITLEEFKSRWQYDVQD